MRTAIVRIVITTLLCFLSTCAIHKVETAKSLYWEARQAQEAGNDIEAISHWKAVVQKTDQEISAGHYLSTNYFMRASAYFELGEWDRGFADLKQLQPDQLREEELWIYPLYSVLIGDYYSQKSMTLIAENFYQSVLKKSAYKSSPVYLLALERHVNNAIRAADAAAPESPDPEKYKMKTYEDLSKEVQKYLEDVPYASVPHFLMADLLLKTKQPEPALEHFLASLEMGLPTADLRHSAEFEIATLLSDYKIPPRLKTVLLARGAEWWSQQNSETLSAGENNVEWLLQQEGSKEGVDKEQKETRIRYLAVRNGQKLKILAWEKL